MVLKLSGDIGRFMDGIGLAFNESLVYILDDTGGVHIGSATFPRDEFNPVLSLRDIVSQGTIHFDGDRFRFPGHCFTWFSCIKEAGVLYGSLDLLHAQSKVSMARHYSPFVRQELFFETHKEGVPLGENARRLAWETLDDVAFVYTHAVEWIYAKANENHAITQGAIISQTPPEIVQGADTLAEFLARNPPHCREALRQLVNTGVDYDATKTYDENVTRLLAYLRLGIPQDVIEAGYQRFIAEQDGKRRLEALRAEYPKERIKGQLASRRSDPHRYAGTG